jgi:hypothetical protein
MTSAGLICGQITRDEAMIELGEPLYDPDELEADIVYFCKKLQIKRHEFDDLMEAPVNHYSDFPNWDRRHRVIKKMQTVVERVTGRKRNIYS